MWRLIALGLIGACRFEPPDVAPGDGPGTDTLEPDSPPPVIDAPEPDAPEPARAGSPIALWRFSETSGLIASDSAAGSPVPLTLTAASIVTWGNGGLRFDARSQAISPAKPHFNQAARTSGAVTLEAWVTPSFGTQGAVTPANVAASSISIMLRNVAIEQRGGVWAARVRTSATTGNGEPPILGSAVSTSGATHLVVVADATQRVLYVDGVAFSSTPALGGSLAGWDPNFKFRIGDEDGANRSWLGTYWLVAVYDEALTPGEVMQNYLAGHDCTGC